MDDPVFLLSSERSGSNLLRVMMDSHPRMSAPHSPHILKTFIPLLVNYGDLRTPSTLRQLAEDMVRVVEVQLRGWSYLPTPDEVVRHAPEPTFSGLVRGLYGSAAAKDGKQRSFIKDNGAIPHASDVTALFPNAKFVYLVRDARDMALSWKKSPGHPGGVKDAARMWRNEQAAALRFFSFVHDTPRILLVKYERLVAEPEPSLRQICEFIGEAFDPAMLQFHKGSEAKTSADAAIGWKNLVRPVMTGNTQKFKQELSKGELRAIERIAGRQMLQLGYQPDLVTEFRGTEEDLIGKLFRAGRTAARQLLRGRAGIRELKMRTQRLAGLRDIGVRAARQNPAWDQADPPSAGDTTEQRT